MEEVLCQAMCSCVSLVNCAVADVYIKVHFHALLLQSYLCLLTQLFHRPSLQAMHAPLLIAKFASPSHTICGNTTLEHHGCSACGQPVQAGRS